jgi:hypothetical protein
MVLFATMSDPVALGLLPLALLRLVCLPRWRERAVALVYLGGMAVQLAVVLTTRRATGVGPSLRQVVFGYDLRVVSTSFLSLAKTDELVHSAGPSAVTYVAAVVVLALAAALLAARGRRTMVLVAAGASVAFFAVACYFSPLSGYPPTGQYRLVLGVSSRYTLVPALFLLTAWVVAAQNVLPRLRRGYGPALLALVAAPLVLAGVFDFRPAMGLRGLATDWSTQVQQARQSCVADENHAPIDVPIEPGGVMWRVQLDCSDLG